MNIPPREQQKPIIQILKERYGLNLEAAFSMLHGDDDYFPIRCVFPDHADRNPSFMIYGDGHFCCYGCSRAGDTYELVKHMEPKLSPAEIVEIIRMPGPVISYAHKDKPLDLPTFHAISQEIKARGGDNKERFWKELDSIVENKARKGLALRLLKQLPKEDAMEPVNAYEYSWSKGDILEWTTPGGETVHLVMMSDYDPKDPSGAFHVEVRNLDGTVRSAATTVSYAKIQEGNLIPLMVNEPTIKDEEPQDDIDPFAAVAADIDNEEPTIEEPAPDPLTMDLEDPLSEAATEQTDEAPEEPTPEPEVEEPEPADEPAEEPEPEPAAQAETVEEVDVEHAAQEIARWVGAQERKKRVVDVVEEYGPVLESWGVCDKDQIKDIIENSPLFETKGPGWITVLEAPATNEPTTEEPFDDPEVQGLPEATETPMFDLDYTERLVEAIEARVLMKIMATLHAVTGQFLEEVKSDEQT